MRLDSEIIRLAQGLMQHASSRQNVIANNIANADTPGFKARDLDSFQKIAGDFPKASRLTGTRAAHITLPENTSGVRPHIVADGEVEPNGNSVSLEDQMMRAAQTRQDHQLAMGVYQKSRQMFRLALGRNG